MKNFIARSRSIEETAQSQKGMIWILELLVFVAVFFVGTIAEQFIALPAQFVMMFTDKEYVAAAASGDVNQTMQALAALNERLMAGDAIWIVMLFSNIMLIVVVCLFCRLLQKRKLRTLGFIKKDMFKEYGLGLLVGFVMFSLCVGIGILTGGWKFDGVAADFAVGIFVLYLLGYMIQGMAEEVLCRGYFLGSYARRYPVYAAIIANSLFFAALHLMNDGITVLAFINLTLFGIFASLYFVRRGNIWGVGALHSIWNLVQGNFYGIQVSGMPVGNTLLHVSPVEGRDWLNGGSFGMEGSIICTAVYVAGIIWLLLSKNKDGEIAERS